MDGAASLPDDVGACLGRPWPGVGPEADEHPPAGRVLSPRGQRRRPQGQKNEQRQYRMCAMGLTTESSHKKI